MELTVTGRHVQISDKFRRLAEDKLAKIEQLEPRAQRVEVVVSEETSRGAPKGSERVEITCRAKGPVIRAEAFAEDKYAAIDLAIAKLTERLRRARDRKVHRRRSGAPDILGATSGLQVVTLEPETATAPLEETVGAQPQDDAADATDERLGALGNSPVQVREKTHSSPPMTLDQALYSMELVGHDFFLFHDSDTDTPSVVYRRRGWDYGVIHLDVTQPQGDAQRPAPTPGEAS